MLNKPQMILLDLDGTLVDSVPDLAFCADAMMEQLGLPTRGEEQARDWVGNGMERFVRRALVGALKGEPDEALFQRAYPIFLQLYAENTARRSTVYPGVCDALDYMQAMGYPLGCVTNKASSFTETLLKELGLRDYFGVVVCGDTLSTKKPDPAPLLYAARKLNAVPLQSLMIGDSVNDVRAARSAGFQVVCVSYGYNHGQDINKAMPDKVVDSLLDLMGTI
ncbi:MAG: phosphoglycolate phosphatase [Candidatus Polarisedimenticolaceae bacterium]|nr:phosphoglycolate phosphatase [Candidatus Polarisedimenticolaceae bacterium]